MLAGLLLNAALGRRQLTRRRGTLANNKSCLLFAVELSACCCDRNQKGRSNQHPESEMKFFTSVALAGIATAAAAPDADLVTKIPGFADAVPYKLYSGYLTVPGPINGYDELKIHCALLHALACSARVVCFSFSFCLGLRRQAAEHYLYLTHPLNLSSTMQAHLTPCLFLLISLLRCRRVPPVLERPFDGPCGHLAPRWSWRELPLRAVW